MSLTKLQTGAKTKGKIEFDDKKIVTGRCRLSYPHLHKAKEYKGKKSWSAQLLFEKDDDLSELEVAAQNAAIETWGSDTSKWPSRKIKSKKTGKIINKSLLRSPFRDGDLEKPDKEEYEGKIFIGASRNYNPEKGEESDQAPEVFDQKRKPLGQRGIKAGDYVRAKLVATAYDVEGSVGVKFTLLAIQKIETGEALGGGGSSVDDFEDVDYDDVDDMEDDNEEVDSEDEDEELEDERPKKKKKSYSY